jgi:hypothetical protein
LIGVCTVVDGEALRPGTSWFGHPPFEAPRRQVVELDAARTLHPSRLRYSVRLSWEVLRFAMPLLLALVLPAWFVALASARAELTGPAFLLVAVPVLTLLAFLALGAAIVLLKWTLVGRARPGMHPLWSSWASRWDFLCLAWSLYMDRVASALDGTPFLIWLLRAVGVRVGKGVVLGAGFASDLPDPDMLTFEDGATVDCAFQAHTFEDRVLKMDEIRIGRFASLGRNAVLLYGVEVGAGASVAPNSVVMKHEHLLAGQRYEGFPIRATVRAEAPVEPRSAAGTAEAAPGPGASAPVKSVLCGLVLLALVAQGAEGSEPDARAAYLYDSHARLQVLEDASRRSCARRPEPPQNTRIAISAGAASSLSILSSSLSRVNEKPCISSEVQ